MISQLEALCRPGGPLQAEPPNANEFSRLCAAAARSLADARIQGISLEGRFIMAYGAAHAWCSAALRYHGYRPQNRYIVFQALPHTLGLGPEVWRVLSHAHNRRNKVVYEGGLDVSEALLRDVIKACQIVADALKELPPIGQKF